MGPLLLARLMELSEGGRVLNIAFRMADEQALPLLDLKDLQAVLTWVGENRKELSLRYGNVSTSSVGTIQRRLLVLENQGATGFFGEPALALSDLMQVNEAGQGQINILAADKLMGAPAWRDRVALLLSELEQLPEVGDPDKPKRFSSLMKHFLFEDASKPSSKGRASRAAYTFQGVGVYFVTQHPGMCRMISYQLGNRVNILWRSRRATRDLRAAAETYRDNPRFDTEAAIREVGRARR